MADPNRKINLDLPSDDDDSDEVLEASEITLVKEFEEEFKDRFTDEDQIFSDFCKQKPKQPPIVFPFDAFHHHGHRGGGRFQSHRQNFDNRRNNDGNNDRSYNNHYRRDHSHDHRDRGDRGNRGRFEPPGKRYRDDPGQSGRS